MSLYEGELTRVAYCWRIERRDGAGVAITSHDQGIWMRGDYYSPSPGIVPASIRLESGLEPDDFEVAGSVTCDGLTSEELGAGLWDGAEAIFMAVDWSQPDAAQHELFRGEFGEIGIDGQEYTTTVRGAAAQLDQPASPETSPLCRARFGDPSCRVDQAGRTRLARVIDQIGLQLTIEEAVGDEFLFGQATILDGISRGFSSSILSVEGAAISLRELPSAILAAGTSIELRQGCDKRFATCRDRFANSRNFRGEPHLPGTDLLTRYPGA